jgi:3',5'-cyclic-AMP phosphodiesterase
LPAVGYNFRDQDPVGWVEADFTTAGVDLTLHASAGNRSEDGKRQFLEWG